MARAEQKQANKKAVAKNTATAKEKRSLIQRLVNVFKLITQKKKEAQGRRKNRNEFRYNNQTGHPNYIFEEAGKRYKALGITHEEETFNKKNMPLKKNPQKNNTSKAYIRNGIISESKKSFGRKLKDYEFSKEDKANVKSKIRNYKKRRKEQMRKAKNKAKGQKK